MPEREIYIYFANLFEVEIRSSTDELLETMKVNVNGVPSVAYMNDFFEKQIQHTANDIKEMQIFEKSFIQKCQMAYLHRQYFPRAC